MSIAGKIEAGLGPLIGVVAIAGSLWQWNRPLGLVLEAVGGFFVGLTVAQTQRDRRRARIAALWRELDAERADASDGRNS